MSITENSSSVELERHVAHLSIVEEQDAPYTMSGIAIGEGDVTRGQSGVLKKWPREALKPAAETLEGRPLVVDHENSSYGTVGTVTRVEYRDGVGVLYEAEIHDEELAEKIEQGLLEVSIRGYHEDIEELDTDPETGAKVIAKMAFDNLSVVPTGAAPSNTAEIGNLDVEDDTVTASDRPVVQTGPSNELSAAECAEMLADEELERPEGAEEDGNPDKLDEQPERFPEGDDTPQEEASEHTGDDASVEEADETSLSDDADTEDSQSTGAGASDEPDSIIANLTLVHSTMTTEEELDNYDDPHVVEGDELDDLREQAGKVDELETAVEELQAADEADEADDTESEVEALKEHFEDDLAELKDRTAVLDEVSRDDVESLAETDNPVIVESDDYDELQGDVDFVRGVYAESLAGHVDVSAERIEDKWSLDEMKDDLEAELEDDASVEEELSPDIQGTDVEEEDLEEAAEEVHEDNPDELSEEAKEEQERLRESILG